MKTLLVKTWCENTKEGVSYLLYNGYGNRVERVSSDKFLCYNVDTNNLVELKDVEILRAQ